MRSSPSSSSSAASAASAARTVSRSRSSSIATLTVTSTLAVLLCASRISAAPFPDPSLSDIQVQVRDADASAGPGPGEAFYTEPAPLLSNLNLNLGNLGSASLSASELNATCLSLAQDIPALLFSGPTSLSLVNAFALYYAPNSNPSTSDLFSGIPTASFSPSDDVQGAITSAGEWDREAVRADEGYGEEDEIQSGKGGLPSFCRFGADVRTSAESKVSAVVQDERVAEENLDLIPHRHAKR